MNDTTRHTDTVTEDGERNSLDREKKSFCELRQGMLFGLGESLSTTVDSKASTVLCSETRASTVAVNSFDRRMRLLIASGLIRGITPTSIRRECGVAIPDFVSLLPDGDDAVEQKAAC